MASRDDLLGDPRSGAKPLGGGARQGRPPRDQATRDDLARARARKRPANTTAQPKAKTKAPARRPRPTPPVGKPRETAAATRPLPAVGDEDQEAAPEPAPAAAPARSVNFGSEGSGVFLALFIYPIAINFLKGGQAQAWGWVKAKWLNQPYGTAAPAKSGGGGGSNLSAPGNMRRVLR